MRRFLRERVVRLISPVSKVACPVEGGWIGVGVVSIVVGFVVMMWFAGATRAEDETLTRGEKTNIAVRGPVLDDNGRAISERACDSIVETAPGYIDIR